MAIVLTVAQQKGGAGKTMLAASLAAALAADRRVAVVDIDPQRSLARWHALRAARPAAAAISFSDLSGWRLPRELDRLGTSHDVVIVDSPPQLDADARTAIRAATLVLVPLQPAPPDLWAAEGTLKLAAEAGRPARIVLNRAPAAGKLRQAVEADIARGGHAVLAATLGNRTGFAGAFAQGLGVTESAPRSVASVELQALLGEILEVLKQARM
jgi:chromosome partitioning protein